MTAEEIRSEINASPELLTLAQSGNTQAIADVLSEGRTQPVKTEIGTGTILAVFQGLGGLFLDTLTTIGETNRDIYWLMQGTILRGVLDTGDAATRVGIQNLKDTPGMEPFGPGLQALLNLGVGPARIDEFSVRKAIYADDGTLLVGV